MQFIPRGFAPDHHALVVVDDTSCFEVCFVSDPLPPGEGVAKRRVRDLQACKSLIRPFGPPSPGGRRSRDHVPDNRILGLDRRVPPLYKYSL